MSWWRDQDKAGGRRDLTAVERQKIYDAGRASVRAELIADGCTAEIAERWLAEWTRPEVDLQVPAFWPAGYRWILAEIASGVEPPVDRLD